MTLNELISKKEMTLNQFANLPTETTFKRFGNGEVEIKRGGDGDGHGQR